MEKKSIYMMVMRAWGDAYGTQYRLGRHGARGWGFWGNVEGDAEAPSSAPSRGQVVYLGR